MLPFEISFAERSIPALDAVIFWKTKEAWGDLSNMAAGFPLEICGTTFPTVEALYQCARYPHLPDIQREIAGQRSPMGAKMVAKRYRARTRPDWDAVRVDVMWWCLKVKLIQHQAVFGSVLRNSGNAAIVERSHRDRFWGAVPTPDGASLFGANVLGQLLVQLRQVHSAESSLPTVEPPRIQRFEFMGVRVSSIQTTAAEVGGATPQTDQMSLFAPMDQAEEP